MKKPSGRLPQPPAQRFLVKVVKTEDCWFYTGGKDRWGYGRFWDGRRLVTAHRFAYEWLVGPIPDGLQLDHICHNNASPPCYGGTACLHRACVNPAHLEPVTALENTRRVNWKLRRRVNRLQQNSSPVCRSGHPFETTAERDRNRRCRTCARAAKRRYKHRVRSARKAVAS